MHWFHFDSVPFDGNDLSRRQLLRISTCCGRMVWGLVITLVLVAGAARLPFTYGLDVPTCMLGFIIVYSGIIPLNLIHGISPHWHKQSRASLILGLFILYFAPFLFWWSMEPNEMYYAVNGILCLMCITGLLAVLNAIAGSYARRIEDEAFRIEAKLSMWAVLAIYGLPLAYGVVYATGFMLRHQSNPLAQIRLGISSATNFILLIGCIPLLLTAINLWKTRLKCIELIRK